MSIPLDVVSLLGGVKTFGEAKARADRSARKRNETRYVLEESGAYYVASDEDLHTFFAGNTRILYVTES